MLAQHVTCLSAQHCMFAETTCKTFMPKMPTFPLLSQVPGRAGRAAGVGAGAVLAAEQGPGAAGDAASVPGPRHSNHCVFAARPGCASEVPTPAQLRPSLTALLVPGPRHRRHRSPLGLGACPEVPEACLFNSLSNSSFLSPEINPSGQLVSGSCHQYRRLLAAGPGCAIHFPASPQFQRLSVSR